MDYEIIQSTCNPDEWRVEAIDYESDGQVYVAIFTGPDARQRAEEYAAWKRSEVPEPVG